MRGWRTVGSELVRAPNFRICWQRHSDTAARCRRRSVSRRRNRPNARGPPGRAVLALGDTRNPVRLAGALPLPFLS